MNSLLDEVLRGAVNLRLGLEVSHGREVQTFNSTQVSVGGCL